MNAPLFFNSSTENGQFYLNERSIGEVSIEVSTGEASIGKVSIEDGSKREVSTREGFEPHIQSWGFISRH